MATETFDSIASDVKQKKFSPVYFFCGEEEFFIDQLVVLMENSVLNESEKAFNQSIIYGKDATGQNVIETCRRLPMMAERQLVIIKEAQAFKEIDALVDYFKKPVSSTVLVIVYKHGTPDKRKEFGKTIQKQAVYFQSDKMKDYLVLNWAKTFIQKSGYKIDDNALELFIEYTGNDLTTISNSLEKLIIGKQKGATILADDIEKCVGISKEYNVFELSSAIANKDATKAYKIVNYFAANPKNGPLVLVLGTLQGFFNKVYIYQQNKQKTDSELASLLKVSPYFIKDYRTAGAKYSNEKIERIFYTLEEFDLRSKGINNPSLKDGDLLKEMVIKIFA